MEVTTILQCWCASDHLTWRIEHRSFHVWWSATSHAVLRVHLVSAVAALAVHQSNWTAVQKWGHSALASCRCRWWEQPSGEHSSALGFSVWWWSLCRTHDFGWHAFELSSYPPTLLDPMVDLQSRPDFKSESILGFTTTTTKHTSRILKRRSVARFAYCIRNVSSVMIMASLSRWRAVYKAYKTWCK